MDLATFRVGLAKPGEKGYPGDPKSLDLAVIWRVGPSCSGKMAPDLAGGFSD